MSTEPIRALLAIFTTRDVTRDEIKVHDHVYLEGDFLRDLYRAVDAVDEAEADAWDLGYQKAMDTAMSSEAFQDDVNPYRTAGASDA